MNSAKQNHSSVSDPAEAVNADAGRLVLADLEAKLSHTSKEEELELERHKDAISSITARREKLLRALDVIREFYFQSILSPKVEVKRTTNHDTATTQDNYTDYEEVEPNNNGESSSTDRSEYNFARGELAQAFADIVHEEDDFLATDEIINAVRDRYPMMHFDKAAKKRITDSLKHIRDRQRYLVGEQFYKGRFLIFLHGSPDFYIDFEKRIFKPGYEEKLNKRVNEIGLTEEPVDLNQEKEPDSIAQDVTDEEVAQAHALLRRPKSSLGLF